MGDIEHFPPEADRVFIQSTLALWNSKTIPPGSPDWIKDMFFSAFSASRTKWVVEKLELL